MPDGKTIPPPFMRENTVIQDAACSSDTVAMEAEGRIEVHCCGRDWILLRPADLESLWDSMTDDEFTEDERLPYWVELWPASLALSAWLEQNKALLQGRCCLDLGCGLGLTALVAQSFGARTIGIDYELAALKYAAKNALYNKVDSPLWAAMDWRFPAVRKHGADFIWGGDIMYERRFVLPVLDFMEYALKPDGRMWIAEPNRNVYGMFRHSLESRGWASRRVYQGTVQPLHVQKSLVTVSLWEISRKP